MKKQERPPDVPQSESAADVPVPIDRPRPSLLPAIDAPPCDWATNYDLTTFEGKSALMNAANPADWIPSVGGEIILDVTHFVVMPDEHTDEDSGAVTLLARCIFVGKDGKRASLTSDFGARKVHAMMMMYSADDWKRGIRMRFYAKDSRRPGRKYGTFEILGHSPESKTGGKS